MRRASVSAVVGYTGNMILSCRERTNGTGKAVQERIVYLSTSLYGADNFPLEILWREPGVGVEEWSRALGGDQGLSVPPIQFTPERAD